MALTAEHFSLETSNGQEKIHVHETLDVVEHVGASFTGPERHMSGGGGGGASLRLPWRGRTDKTKV